MLGVILGHTELALEQVSPSAPLHEDLEEVRQAAARSADLTRQLLAFARKQMVTPKVLDLNATVEGMVKMLQRMIGEDVSLRFLPGAALGRIRMDPSQLDQILANLCVNARDAIADVGTVTIETSDVTLDAAYCATHPGVAPGEYVRLVVRDDGCGMDEATRSRIFEPFFTTKGVGKGTGLGLATVYGVVDQNRGFIDVESAPGQGSAFAVHLPRYVGDAGAAPAASVGPRAPGHETILLVEDERAILRLAQRLLVGLGYAVLSAGTPSEALRLAREHPGRIDLLVTDVVMPEMNGRQLADEFAATRPAMKRLFVSGYPADVLADHGALAAGTLLLAKPFTRSTLAMRVREALADAAPR
jgi:CheY-like chemotaxis protein